MSGELHLAPTATTAIDRVAAPVGAMHDMDGEAHPIGSAFDVGADEYTTPPPAAAADVYVTRAGVLITTLRWAAPANAATTTLCYSRTLIAPVNWASATLLTGTLPGHQNAYTASPPYVSSTLSFALKT